MKRILCTILSILMLLSLTACGASEQDKALETANALIAEGKYQEAYDTLTSLESYTAYQAQVDLAKAEIEKAKGTFLMESNWKETDSSLILSFQEGGALRFDYDIYGWNEEEPSAMWSYEEGVLKVSRVPGLELEDGGVPTHVITIEEQDGVTHLIIDEFDFVREEDYAPYEPIPVQINNNNWGDYFELLDVPCFFYDESGNVTDARMYHCLCLRELYQDRARMDISLVSIGYTGDILLKNTDGDNIRNEIIPLGYTVTSINLDAPYSGILTDYNHLEITESDRRSVSLLYEGYWNAYNEDQFVVMEDINIYNMRGVLMLRPE